MKNVETIFGNVEAAIAANPVRPYSDDVCAFLGEFSVQLMKLGRAHSDIMSLGFWCRRANVQKLKETFGDNSGRVGRGLCFHIAPSNIPVNFAFTCVFGLLAGNSNIVRMPSKKFTQTDIVVRSLSVAFEKFSELKDRVCLVGYPRESCVSAEFSKIADARMIWGGDSTVSTLKSMPTKPRCIDIAFADRYSLCVIDADAVLKVDERTLGRLCQNFYNDTYLMDQNACSSPQLICWLNDKPAARKKFWNSVFLVAEKQYVLQDAVCVDKYTKLCENAVRFKQISSVCRCTNLLYRSEISRLEKGNENIRGRGGYFYEYALGSFDELLPIIDEKYQTLTYFGIDATALAQKLSIFGVRGIDRIVPIGEAMNIGVFWDGFDLVSTLSRRICVQ